MILIVQSNDWCKFLLDQLGFFALTQLVKSVKAFKMTCFEYHIVLLYLLGYLTMKYEII